MLTLLTVSCDNMLGRTARIAAMVPGNAAATAANVAARVGEGNGQGATAAYNCAQATLFQPVVAGGLPGVSRYALLDQRTQTGALFLRGELELGPAWSLVAGLRLNAEEKRGAQSVRASAYAAGNKLPSTNPLHVSFAQADSLRAKYLRAKGVQYAQGWLFGRPQPLPDVLAALRTQREQPHAA